MRNAAPRRVALERTQMEVENRLADLSPGMAVTVEIKAGSRRVSAAPRLHAK
jgi:hypothetical protein